MPYKVKTPKGNNNRSSSVVHLGNAAVRASPHFKKNFPQLLRFQTRTEEEIQQLLLEQKFQVD